MSEKWKIAGINFDHMHMGDLLCKAHDHPDAEIVGICDEQPERMRDAAEKFAIPADREFTDYRACLEATAPDLVILCPATAGHAEWTEKVAPYGAHILMEKPFAGSLAEADRMVEAVRATGKQLVINWPLRWVASHVTTKRLIDEGRIGDPVEVHYYDGNRGPLRHGADKVETEPGAKSESWFYQKAAGGGSLQDYLGYGTTLGTWYLNGAKPLEVMCMADEPEGLEVDEHSVTVARYAFGLSKFETRWGTFTDPWANPPQPRCGFVIVGTEGTISSYDYQPAVHVQTRDKPEGENLPADELPPDANGPISYVLDRLGKGLPIEGPLSPELCRIGQQIVDTAARSAEEKRALPLLDS